MSLDDICKNEGCYHPVRSGEIYCGCCLIGQRQHLAFLLMEENDKKAKAFTKIVNAQIEEILNGLNKTGK